jgi:hypothetical protein
MGASLVIGSLVLVVIVVVVVPLVFFNNSDKKPDNISNYQPPAGTCKRKLDCPDAKGNRDSTSSFYCDNTGPVQSITLNGSLYDSIDNAYFELISGANGKGCNGIFNVPKNLGAFTFTIKNSGTNYDTYNNTLNIYTDNGKKTQVKYSLVYLDVTLDDSTSTQGKCIEFK